VCSAPTSRPASPRGRSSATGPWPGVHAAWQVRFDAFPGDRDVPGTRVGASLFAEGSALLLQDAREVGEDSVRTFAFSYLHWGVLVGIRPDPQAPWGGLASFGFGRLDLPDFWGAAYAVPWPPWRGARGGGSAAGRTSPFLDMALKGSWGSARGPAPSRAIPWTTGG